MPIFEYQCDDCQRVSTELLSSRSGVTPLCRRCGSSNMTKLVSNFAFHRGWGDSLNWSPSGETLTDVDEDDPKSLDQFMGRLKEEMGGESTPDFERMRRELSQEP